MQVTVGVSGTGGGFERFCRGETEISNASRPIKDEEATICKDAGIDYVEFQVANDALTVVVNKDNDWVDCLTTDQLKKIWEPGSKVNSWKDVDPCFPDEPIKLYGPGTDSGTFDYFTDEINGEEGASRSDYAASEDDNTTVTGVAGEKGGLGYFGFSYFEENQDTLKALEIDGGDGCVAPSVESRAGRHVQAAVPPALHLRQEGGAHAAGGGGVPALHPRKREVDRGGVAVRAADRRAAGQGQGRPRRRHRGVVGVGRPDGGAEPGSAPSAGGIGEDVVKGAPLPVRADLGRDDGRDRHRALRARRSSSSSEVSIADFLTGKSGRHCSALAASASSRWSAGTLLVTVIASVVAMPLGLGAAIYLSEYASPRTRGFLKPALEILAGIPTIVFGYFALTFMTPLLRDIGIPVDIFNTLSAALVMGVMLLPTVASLSEDAMARCRATCATAPMRSARRRCRSRRASSFQPPSRASSPRSCSRSRGQSARR